METLLTNKIISMTELREPAKVLEKSNGKPVAVMNRNQVVGYFVPVEAIRNVQFKEAGLDKVKAAFNKTKPSIDEVLKYLENK